MKVLAYTSPARGHLYPVVPILAALAERGHGVSVVTLSGELEQVREMGIQARAMDPAVERNQLEDWRERSPRRAIASVMRTLAVRAGGDAADLERSIEDQNPDVLLIDVNCWGAATVAEASGRPWAMYSPFLLPLPSRDVPPFGPGLRPLGGPLGAVRDAVVGRMLEQAFDRMALPALRALRARYGLPALAHYVDLFGRPPLLLALTAEGFEYPRGDWPENVRLVGPMNWAPADPVQSGTPAWLADLSDPLVLVTCSTERQRDRRLVRLALAGLPAAGMSVIATTAAHDPDAFDPPPGSMVVRFVAHEAVLGRAACVVCHGGMGVTQKALAAGVPVVVVPFGRDQQETARRVEAARAGVRIAPRRLSAERLANGVRSAIALRAGAERVRRAFTTAGGPAAAADAIEELGLAGVGRN